MPVDPIIARGINPIGDGMMGSIALAERIKASQRENELAMMDAQYRREALALRQDEFAATQSAERDTREMQWLLPHLEAGNEQAFQYALQKASEAHPQFAEFYRANPEAARKALLESVRNQLGVKPAGTSGALYKVDDSGKPVYLGAEQAAGRRPWQEPERPPSYAPQQPSAAIQNYEYLRNLPPAEQERFLSTQRANATPEIARATAEATAGGKAAAERQAEIDKKIGNMANMGDALDMAVLLVPAATGSLMGAAADRTAAAFGFTLSGAEATASLRVLASKVLENVPRMEGPQSDKDVQMYREAAGQLGDPTVTRGEKMAAIRTIRQLIAKYSARNAAAPAAPQTDPAPTGAPAAPTRLKFDRNGNPVQ